MLLKSKMLTRMVPSLELIGYFVSLIQIEMEPFLSRSGKPHWYSSGASSFESMDTDKNGVISHDEFVTYHKEYFYTVEDKPIPALFNMDHSNDNNLVHC